ncbi:MAG: hypothetical protein CFH43_00414, partial [Proteobacteria bacterium]
MSTNLPVKRVVKVRGMDISVLNADEVIVTQNDTDLYVHLD